MKPERRDPPRRIPPELMAFYKQRAKQLRDQACVDAVRAVWAWVKRLACR